MTPPDTRSTILDVAVELASVRGLEELSIGGLATTVKMSKSGLFAHFGSKHDLQLATVAEAWEIFESEVLRPGPGLWELIERWLSFYERRVFAGGCFFVICAVELADRGDDVSSALEDAVDRQLAALENAIVGAVDAGELSPYVEPARMAFMVHSVLVNSDSLFQVRRDKAVFEGAREMIRELLAAA